MLSFIRFLLIFGTLIGFASAFGVQPGASSQNQLPESAYINGLAGRPQTYALSCEARSAADWAAFWGVTISETEFLHRLPRSDNPNAGFVGDPNGYWGNTPPYAYGVHARPVAALLREYGLPAAARQGMSWDELRLEIAGGRPVIVWVIGQMWGGVAIDYTASDGDTLKVAAFEHTMILVGYDSALVHVVDASTGWVYNYGVETFLRSWEVLGRMAVEWEEPAPPPPPLPPPPADTPPPPPTTTPAPTATLVAISYLNLENPRQIYLPVVGKHSEATHSPEPEVVPAGVCLFTRQGVLYTRPFSFLRGWCISALMIRPEYLMGIAGSIPELP
jgi:uncharacterized protein YvpB